MVKSAKSTRTTGRARRMSRRPRARTAGTRPSSRALPLARPSPWRPVSRSQSRSESPSNNTLSARLDNAMFLRSFALLLAAVLLSLLWAQAAVAQQSPGITVSVNEVVSTSDGPKVLPPAVVSIDESVHVGDAPTVLPPTVVDITESIVATDQPVPVLPFTGCPAAHTSYDFTVANSPFTLTCSLQVDVGQSLTIDPGVQVRMPDGARIDIFGTANINGTPAAPVSIISAVAADPGRWAGVLVRAGSNVQMTSTTIESAGNSYARSLWLFDGATPSLAAITIRQSLGSGIYYEDGAAGSLAGATVDTTTGPGVVLAGRCCPQITNLTVNNASDYGLEL